MDSLSSRLLLFNCLGQLTGSSASGNVGNNMTGNHDQSISNGASASNSAAGMQQAGLEAQSFKQLLDAQSLVDCTLACDGGKISAHKFVLSACSSYLARILAEHPVEHPIIILPELNIEDVRTLIHYMYTGELLKSSLMGQQANSISLLRTAAILSINSLSDLLASNTQALSAAVSSTASLQQQQQLFRSQSSASTTTSSPPPHSLVSSASMIDHLSPLISAIAAQQQQQQMQLASSFPTTSELNVAKNLYDNSAAAAAAASLLWNPDGGLNLGLAGFNPAAAAAAMAAAAAASSLTSGPASGQNSSPSSSSSFTSGLSSASSAASLASPLSVSPAQQQLIEQTPKKLDERTPPPPPPPPLGNHLPATPSSSNEFQFKCPVCQNNFQTICSFEYHMQRIHNVTSFGCELCHKPFASLRYVLTDHMRRCHSWKGAGTLVAAKEAKQQQQQNSQAGS